MQKKKLKQLANHIRSIPHFPRPPQDNWEMDGYQEFLHLRMRQ